MATKIILDVDTGTDDAVALMTAALSPDLELVGATVVNGNTDARHVHREHAAGVRLDRHARGARSTAGMSRPLARPQATQLNPATRIHGDLLDLPPATITAARRSTRSTG